MNIFKLKNTKFNIILVDTRFLSINDLIINIKEYVG